MSNTKAIINFNNYKAAALSVAAEVIHEEMSDHAATFDSPPVSMATFASKITEYETKLALRASRATSDVIAFRDAREKLESLLTELGQYVNQKCGGNAVLVNSSGFPSYTTAHTPDFSPPAAPANLRLRHGTLIGSVVARFKPSRQKATNEVQVNTGDPNIEANWSLKGLFQNGRADLTGLTPGALTWVRVRTIGMKGVMGAWSDPAQIRVI